MAKSAALRLPQVSKGSVHALAPQYGRYLDTVRQLLVAYQRSGACRQVFVQMMHTFMQELCGYPPDGYIVTAAACSETAVGSAPHVLPVSYGDNATLFYFTPAEDADEVQDLWVKHAQVYLVDPPSGNVAAEYATQVVFSNFFVIDGASKDRQTGAWNLWSVADIPETSTVRIDLRHLENATALHPAAWDAVHQRLQTLQYQAPSNVRQEHSS
jgi:hypothetical protein